MMVEVGGLRNLTYPPNRGAVVEVGELRNLTPPPPAPSFPPKRVRLPLVEVGK